MVKEEIVVGIKLEGFNDLNKQFDFLNRRITQTMKANQKQISYANKVMNQGAQALVNNADKTNKLGRAHNGFFKVMGMSQENWQKFNQEGGRFDSMAARSANSIRKFAHGMRGFRMEMLGVMFFGMGMKNFFSGLLKPSLQLAGVFDILKTTLELLFLPIALYILPLAIKLLDWITSMSEETKLLIGKFVLLGIVLGAGLFLFGTITLGVGALIMAFSGLFNIIDKLIPDFSFAGVQMSGFVEAGLGLSLVSKAFELVKSGASILLEKLFEFDFVKEAFDNLGLSVDATKTPFENFKTLASGVIDNIKNEFNFTETFSSIDSGFTGIQDTITDVVDKVLPKLTSLADSLETIADLINSVTGFSLDFGIGELSDKYNPMDSDFWRNQAEKSKAAIDSMDTTIQDNFGTNTEQVSSSKNIQVNQVTTIETTQSTADVELLLERRDQTLIERIARQTTGSGF